MFNYIKNKANSITETIKGFEASEYFSLNYKDTKKFSFTMMIAAATLAIAAYVVKMFVSEK